MKTTEERFWAKVRKDAACWEWCGALQSRGYGMFWGGAKYTPAHRWAYASAKGDPGEALVLHRCDNRRCVNPAHLFLGTAEDNSRDMVRKGRQTIGERNPRARLTSEQVRAARASHLPASEIAGQLGVHPAHVRLIRRRGVWRHI